MIDYIDQSTLNIEWFFSSNEKIANVSSCCGKVPDSILSLDLIQYLWEFFYNLPEIGEFELVNKFKGRLDDHIHFSKRGIYSFLKTDFNILIDTNYTLVTRPLNPLTLDKLPSEIREILLKTVYNEGDISKLTSIDVSKIH